MHQGQACGHLWGAALSAGIRASQELDGEAAISAAALEATRRLTAALSEDGWAFTCFENTGCDFTSLGGKIKYMRSDKPKACGRKALVWANRANSVIDDVLAEYGEKSEAGPCEKCTVACMSKIVGKTGHGAEEIPIVAGFAGGLGLSGNICGALAVGVFALSVSYYRDRDPDRRDSKMRAAFQELNLVESRLRKLPSQLQRDFAERFGSTRCETIAGRKFSDADDHSSYMAAGGCRDVVQYVADWVAGRNDAVV